MIVFEQNNIRRDSEIELKADLENVSLSFVIYENDSKEDIKEKLESVFNEISYNKQDNRIVIEIDEGNFSCELVYQGKYNEACVINIQNDIEWDDDNEEEEEITWDQKEEDDNWDDDENN